MTLVFECHMCGHCCEGKGGIVVSPKDLERICAHLSLSAEEFIEKYGVMNNGKLKIGNGDDGYCVFFVFGKGCAVHEGKPDICRAWPYFRGNMIDSESLFLAKDFCPGIRPNASHAEFVLEGQKYLVKHNLLASDAKTEAHALLPTNVDIES